MLIQYVDHMLSVLGQLFLMYLPRLGRDPTVSLQWVAVTQKGFPQFSHWSPNIQVGVAFPPDASEGNSISSLFLPQTLCHPRKFSVRTWQIISGSWQAYFSAGVSKVLICHVRLWLVNFDESLTFFSQPYSMVDSPSSQHFSQVKAVMDSFFFFRNCSFYI